MSLWSDNTPPIWFPTAVATPAGWANPTTGELLVTITGLSTLKEPNGAPGLAHVRFDKQSYKHGDTAYVIAQFSEAVVVTGTPQVTISVSGSNHTLSYAGIGASASGTAVLTSEALTSITLGSGGTGYLNAPTVVISGGSGSGATARATISGGVVTGFVVTSPGSGYTSVPSVTITPKTSSEVLFSYTVGGSDVAAAGHLAISSPISLNSGTIKATANTMLTINTVTGTFPVGAKVVGATSGATGIVRNATATKLYLSQVTGTFGSETVAVSGSGATLGTPVLLSGKVVSIPVTAGGSNYSIPPIVTITDSGSGINATADAITTVVDGVVTEIIITAPGSLYTSGTISVALSVAGSATCSASAAPDAPLAFTSDPSVALTVMDAVVPTISSVTIPAGSYRTNTTIPISVTFSKIVNVVGTPTATVNFSDSSTTGTAVYSSGSGSTILVFDYIVQAADKANQSDMTISSPLLIPNHSTIHDEVGNPATLTHSETFALVGVNDDGGVLSVTLAANTSTQGGTLDFQTGDVMSFTVNFDIPMVVTGSPLLPINVNATGRNATYVSGSGSTALLFQYTVVTGDSATQSELTSGTGLTLNSGTIDDLAGTAASLTFSQASFTTATVNVAFVTGVTGAPAAGNHITGELETLVVTFNENVTVASAVPYIVVTIGSNPRNFVYTVGSGTKQLSFAYTLVTGDAATAGNYTIGTGITANGATLTNAAAKNATLTFSAPVTTGVVVNDPAPTIGTPTIVASNYTTGQIIPIVVTANKAVTVVGIPTIALTTTGGSRVVNYSSGTGTTTLTFNYTVVAGDTIGAVSSAATSLTIPGGASIKDALGTAVTNTFSAASTFAGVATNDVLATLGTPVGGGVSYPTLTHPAALTLTFTASKAVTVTGSPEVAVTTAGGTRQAVYASGTGTTSLVFSYSTVAGDIGAAGTVTVAGAATLNSGSMKDALGLPITLTFTAPDTHLVSIA